MIYIYKQAGAAPLSQPYDGDGSGRKMIINNNEGSHAAQLIHFKKARELRNPAPCVSKRFLIKPIEESKRITYDIPNSGRSSG
jgi:hypothetical protein